MKLDKLDISLLQEAKSSPGDYIGILQRMYGWKLKSSNHAKHAVGAIKHHINYKGKVTTTDADLGEMEEVEVHSNGSVTTKRMMLLSEEDSQNPSRMMELMGYDPLQWRVKSSKKRRNMWNVTMKLRKIIGYDDSGKPIYEDNPDMRTNHAYMCELTVEPIQNAITSKDVEKIFDNLKPPKLRQYKHKRKAGQLLEIPIMDLHLGKLSWKKESGDDYDLKIAADLYTKTIEDILDKVYSLDLNIERIVFPIGQDFFHFDTSKSTTSKGTVMDTDTRWPKMYEKGMELSVWAIENLRTIAPIDVIYVASNHDKMMSFFLTKHVEAYFRNCKDVKTNSSPYPRKYITYGKCLIGYSHGSDEGKRIDVLMQQECPTWSKTLWREWHLGHLHKEEAREIGGIIIRRMSSITSRDIWHTEHGFQAVRKAQAFIWDKTKGRQLVIDSNVTV